MIKYIVPILLILISSACKKENCKYDDDFPHDCNKGMDVAFLVDYTGSMGPAINDIKTSVTSIVGAINTQSAGNYRLALSIFDEQSKGFPPAYFLQPDYTSLPVANKIVNTTGPTTNQYLTTMEKFSLANQTSFGTQLAKLNASMSLGSGNGVAEPGGMLLDKIVNSAFAGTWRTGISKLAIIITDAPHGGDNYEIHLIGNNILGLKVVKSNFTNISTDIINIINQVCQ